MRPRWIPLAALAAAASLAACRPTPRSTTPAPAPAPLDDLSGAIHQVPDGYVAPDHEGAGDDRRLGDDGPRVVHLDVIHLNVVGHDDRGEPIIDATTPGPLLDKGNEAFRAGKLEEAASWYRKLVADFPDSALAPAALYNIALVYEKQGRPVDAIAAYREVAVAYPASVEGLDGALRAAALLAERARWADAVSVLDAVLARDDLSRELRIEALARKGYARLEQGALDDAQAVLEQAVAVWRKAHRIEDPYYIAMAHFYLGEIELRRFHAAPLRSGDAQLQADMAARRALVMAAYARWRETLEFKHAYWATAAGYQMSQVFYEYWKAAVEAPYPDGMDAAARPAYVLEVRDRVRENLTKALDGHRANVSLAEAYGVSTSWSEGSKIRATEILAVLDKDARMKAAASASR